MRMPGFFYSLLHDEGRSPGDGGATGASGLTCDGEGLPITLPIYEFKCYRQAPSLWR
jgi:hypothetical protein